MLWLKPGQVSIAKQSAAKGEPVPVGCTVEELQLRGYIVDGPPNARLLPAAYSETGYVITTGDPAFYEQHAILDLGG